MIVRAVSCSEESVGFFLKKEVTALQDQIEFSKSVDQNELLVQNRGSITSVYQPHLISKSSSDSRKVGNNFNAA